MTFAGGCEHPLGQVVRDLRPEIVLDIEWNSIRIQRFKIPGGDLVFQEKGLVARVELEKALGSTDPIDFQAGHPLQAVGKRVIPSGPDRTIFGAGGNAEIIKTDSILVNQANGRLRSVFLFVKQPEKLLAILPVPSGIVQV